MALTAAADLRRLGGICAQDYDNRMQAVMSIRANAARTVADAEEAHRNLASQIRQRMGDLDAAREQMARNLRDHLSHFHKDLAHSVRSRVADLEHAHKERASEISHRLQEMGDNREKMAAEQQHRLTDEHIRLEATVNQIREDLADDVSDLHRAYSDFSRQMQARHSGKPGSRPSSTHAATTAAADDLSIIAGIGPGRQQKLNEMGIRTFAHLAHASADSLREALGSSAHLVNVEEWIQSAKKRI